MESQPHRQQALRKELSSLIAKPFQRIAYESLLRNLLPCSRLVREPLHTKTDRGIA